VYDKPWRETEQIANTIYRPSKNADKEYGDEFEKELGTRRFVPDKGFAGADKSGSRPDGPVVFEQETNFDPFQIDDFLGNLKQKSSSSKQDESVKEPSKKKSRK